MMAAHCDPFHEICIFLQERENGGFLRSFEISGVIMDMAFGPPIILFSKRNILKYDINLFRSDE